MDRPGLRVAGLEMRAPRPHNQIHAVEEGA